MSHRFRLLVVAIALAGLSACGGGGGVAPQTVTPTDGVWIVNPTVADTFDTTEDKLQLTGGSFVPAGSACPTTLAAGYSVAWTNVNTGGSGQAIISLGCLLQVNVLWQTFPIPLAMGLNTITVTATDALGRTESDSLRVTRSAL